MCRIVWVTTLDSFQIGIPAEGNVQGWAYFIPCWILYWGTTIRVENGLSDNRTCLPSKCLWGCAMTAYLRMWYQRVKIKT